MASALRPSAACIARRQASGELLRMQLSELVPGAAARSPNPTRLQQHGPSLTRLPLPRAPRRLEQDPGRS